MPSITVQPEFLLERILSLEIVRVTERAAVSSARLRGHGKDKASDQAAVDAMARVVRCGTQRDLGACRGRGRLADGPSHLDLEPSNQFFDEWSLTRQYFSAGGRQAEIGDAIDLGKAPLLSRTQRPLHFEFVA